MTSPTTTHKARFRQDAGAGDGRLDSPTFHRNAPPLIAELGHWLGQRPGSVLEIGSGTGQHVAAFALAFRHITWHASEPDELHRNSIRAWAEHLGAPVHGPLALDAASDWAALPGVAAIAPLDAVYSMNVIHIAPSQVLQGIVGGAARVLSPGGLLIFYGPFIENGAHTGPGNAAFDAGLRAENPDWGLRDIADIDRLGESSGLGRAALITMPANNRLLIYRKA